MEEADIGWAGLNEAATSARELSFGSFTTDWRVAVGITALSNSCVRHSVGCRYYGGEQAGLLLGPF